MTGIIIVVLVVIAIVVGAAYLLGTYLQRRDRTRAQNAKPISPTPAPPTPDAPPAMPAFMPKRELPAAHEVSERQVKAITNWLVSQAFEQTGINVSKDKVAYQRIIEAATLATRDLQTEDSVRISLPFLTADATGPKHLDARLSRLGLRELVED